MTRWSGRIFSYSSHLWWFLVIFDIWLIFGAINKPQHDHICYNSCMHMFSFSSSNYVLTDEQSLWIEDTTKSVYQVSPTCNKPMIEKWKFRIFFVSAPNRKIRIKLSSGTRSQTLLGSLPTNHPMMQKVVESLVYSF